MNWNFKGLTKLQICFSIILSIILMIVITALAVMVIIPTSLSIFVFIAPIYIIVWAVAKLVKY